MKFWLMISLFVHFLLLFIVFGDIKTPRKKITYEKDQQLIITFINRNGFEMEEDDFDKIEPSSCTDENPFRDYYDDREKI